MNFNPQDIVAYEDLDMKARDRVVALMDKGKSFRAAVQQVTKEVEKKEKAMVKIIFNRLLGGWYIVRGAHQTPISGRFNSRAEAAQHLKRKR